MDGCKRERIATTEAVSPVIATVLLLAITVLLTGAVYMMMASGVQAPNKGVPVAKASVRILDNGYQVVTISEMNAQVEKYTELIQTVSTPDEKIQLVAAQNNIIAKMINLLHRTVMT